ncbi:hypothetical protein TWF718_007997 [Orbilia javanica]|uniref:Uncharacterized protein n=1 Tax=Orbilia javanica TaxID=47235 RepID=A0AAN8RMM6_9PEZI
MPAIKTTEPHEPKRHGTAATVLMDGVNTFSQAASSQRKRKRGVSNLPRSGDESISARLDVKDLDIIAGSSRLRSSLKALVDDVDAEVPSVSRHQKLSAPTPHAAQVRLDRQEAYSTTKQTLNKWTDTVKSVRSADQLVFPLEGKAGGTLSHGNHHSSHQSGQPDSRPSTKLENRISLTLSLAVQGPEKDKTTLGSAESKSKNKHTKARTAHLRMERELLLRKEAKAKRLKKIKSKSYRRILRKTQRKTAEDLLPPGNTNADEMEVLGEGGDYCQSDSSQPEAEQDHGVICPPSVDKVALSELPSGTIPGQRLFAMKFMEEAEKRNAVKDKPLEGSECQEFPQGRRIFHDGLPVDSTGSVKSVSIAKKKSAISEKVKIDSPTNLKSSRAEEATNPWLCPQSTNGNSGLEAVASVTLVPQRDEKRTSISVLGDRDATIATLATFPTSGSILPSLAPQTPDEALFDTARGDQPGLLARAFAGDNILPEIQGQQPKQSSPQGHGALGLQGWGTWDVSLGSASRSRKQKKASGRKSEYNGTRIEKVVLNQQICKKGSKYLATTLPYPFETGDQYERSLRFPIGQEWSTKQTHQALTAPKVIVKGGTVIAPLS